jgi:hypothetical protein
MSRQQHYPRSLPFRAPECVVAPPVVRPGPVMVPPPAAPVPPGPPRRLPVYLAAYCVGFLGLGLGLGALLVNRGAPHPEAVPEDRSGDRIPVTERKAPPAPAGGKVETPSPSVPVPKTEKKETPAARPAQNAATKFPIVAPAAPLVSETALEVLGALTAAQLHQTHLNIGLLADAVEEGVYKPDEAKDMIHTIAGLLSTVEKQFDRLAGEGLKEDDKKSMEEARQVLALLRTQSKELEDYWKTNDKDHVARFHKAREEAWKSIKSMVSPED